MLKRIPLNWRFVVKKAISLTCGLYAFFGFIGLLFPFSELLKCSLPVKMLISIFILFVIYLLSFIFYAIYLSLKKRFKIISANSGHALYLQYGDIFSKDEVECPDERRNIVIPVNRCFDTIVDNKLVSEKTLHGITFKKLYKSSEYDEKTLNQRIHQLLNGKEYDMLNKAEKPAGNLQRFPVGTVVDLPVSESEKEHYFLWALSTFDEELRAHTSMQDYSLAVQRLIEACNNYSEGFPVILPLVGTGLSRTKKEQQDVLAYLINAFRLNRSEINCDIHIVIREDIKSAVSIMDYSR